MPTKNIKLGSGKLYIHSDGKYLELSNGISVISGFEIKPKYRFSQRLKEWLRRAIHYFRR